MSRSTRTVSTISRATFGPLGKGHPNVVSLLRRVDSCPRFYYGWAKVQPAVVLILKRLRKRDHCFKPHMTDMRTQESNTGPPDLQGIGYRRRNSLVCGRVSWLLHVLAGWVYGFQGASDAQPAVVLVLKRLRRRDHGFKSHPTDWEKSAIEPATPGLEGIG